ncbi:MAG: MarR family winged helix-turn-helix transcriptional regulator [Stellaceae bacterium]
MARQLEIFDHPGHLIRRLHQISVSVFLNEAKPYGLTQVQYASLQAIEFYSGIDQRRLGKVVALDRQTVSNVVQRLCEKGLVDRKQKDKRTSALYLTGAAKALLEVMRPRIEVVDQIILAPLAESERTTLMSLLNKLVDLNNALSRAPREAF